jgi:hypothetical protein
MNIPLLLMTGTLGFHEWQTLTMHSGHKFMNTGRSLLPRMDYWELPGTHQRRFVQHYVQVDFDNLLKLMEVSCLHVITSSDEQGVVRFCHTLANCKKMYHQWRIMMRDVLRRTPADVSTDAPPINFSSWHPAACDVPKEGRLTE